MQTITSKATVKEIVARIVKNADNITVLAISTDKYLLQEKIKFPLLEFATLEILKHVNKKDYIAFADAIILKKRLGGNVLAGIILQELLKDSVVLSFGKASEYMVDGNEWYVCDIIGERVMGHGLLNYPDKAIPLLKELTKNDNKWPVRSVGVAVHYATKKGLPKPFVEQMFLLLLTLSGTTEFHTKTGTGWGAKTVAKFYPDLIEKHHDKIYTDEVRQWFKTKVGIGLSRKDKYATRYRG
jgi:hypothetical protein